MQRRSASTTPAQLGPGSRPLGLSQFPGVRRRVVVTLDEALWPRASGRVGSGFEFPTAAVSPKAERRVHSDNRWQRALAKATDRCGGSRWSPSQH